MFLPNQKECIYSTESIQNDLPADICWLNYHFLTIHWVIQHIT